MVAPAAGWPSGLAGPWETSSVGTAWHGGKQVTMASPCHALEGSSVGVMVIQRSLISSCCIVLPGLDLIDLIPISPGHKTDVNLGQMDNGQGLEPF